jgi:hypothetical protein
LWDGERVVWSFAFGEPSNLHKSSEKTGDGLKSIAGILLDFTMRTIVRPWRPEFTHLRIQDLTRSELNGLLYAFTLKEQSKANGKCMGVNHGIVSAKKNIDQFEFGISLEFPSAVRLALGIVFLIATAVGGIAGTFSDANWYSLSGLVGANGTISAVTVDTNGIVYVGGEFTAIGTVSANNIARWDGKVWSALGTGVSGGGLFGPDVAALVCDRAGTLYAGGSFNNAGGLSAASIAKWDGNSWAPLSSGMDNRVSALAFDSAQNLYAAGYFTRAGGVHATNIAKWNGATWTALGSGRGFENDNFAPVKITSMVCDGAANVYVAGQFCWADGISTTNIAMWNGASWTGLAQGVGALAYSSIMVSSLALDNSGNLYAGGFFTNAGPLAATNIAKWNGSAWSALGLTTNVTAFDSLAADRFGNVYAGGRAANGAIFKWNGNAWSTIASNLNGIVISISCDGLGKVYAGGSFDSVGALYAGGFAKWDGTNWSMPGAGIWGGANALAFDRSGNLYAAGFLSMLGTASVLDVNIAKWNGSTWSALASGINDEVYALAFDGSSNLYAGGSFTNAGGHAASNIAKWNGTNWSAVGLGIPSGTVYALAGASSNIYAGGAFSTAGTRTVTNIARWNSAGWFSVGSGINGLVLALVLDGAGNLFAGGSFTVAGGVAATNVAKWNGTNWMALGSGLNKTVDALALDGLGNVYAGGEFTKAGGSTANYIAKWNGSTWTNLGSGMTYSFSPLIPVLIDALACDSFGNLYAGGRYDGVNGIPAKFIAKWDGTTWSAMGSGMNSADLSGDGQVMSLTFDSIGNLYAGGIFAYAGAKPSVAVAKALLTAPTANQLTIWKPGAATDVVTLLGTPGDMYALESTTNLIAGTWVPQTTNAASTSNATTAGYLNITNSSVFPSRYYRTRHVP